MNKQVKNDYNRLLRESMIGEKQTQTVKISPLNNPPLAEQEQCDEKE